MPKTPEEIAAEAKAAADKAAADKVVADAKAAADAAVAAKAAHLAEHGFPSETPVADMPVEQQAAYWRFESKKHQKVDGAELAKLQADAAELATLKAANATDEEKARDQARREGENIGAERYLKDAVMGRFMALTGKKDDEAETIFAHVDPKSFTDDKGSIDSDKLKAFAATVGTSGSKEDPVAKVLSSQRSAGSGAGTSSIAERRKEVRESLSKNKSNA